MILSVASSYCPLSDFVVFNNCSQCFVSLFTLIFSRKIIVQVLFGNVEVCCYRC
nr:MAG TPA: hypothetical protein [Caudoviricetes sp.]